jgi:hypothetical protein
MPRYFIEREPDAPDGLAEREPKSPMIARPAAGDREPLYFLELPHPMSLTIIERDDHSTMAKRITAKISLDGQPLIFGHCRVSTAGQRDQSRRTEAARRGPLHGARLDPDRADARRGQTLMAIKAAMAECGHRMSHHTVDNLVKRARLAGAV